MTKHGTPLSEGQLARFVGEGTRALALIASRLGPDIAGNWAENGEAMQRAFLEALIPSHVIDCDADPFVPDSWRVYPKDQIESRVRGLLTWDSDAVNLWLPDIQKNGERILGSDLRKKLEDKPVLNANVLDHLLKHPHFIPEEWKGKFVFFWGTVYRHQSGGLCVRYLNRHGGEWSWGSHLLCDGWDFNSPAILRA